MSGWTARVSKEKMQGFSQSLFWMKDVCEASLNVSSFKSVWRSKETLGLSQTFHFLDLKILCGIPPWKNQLGNVLGTLLKIPSRKTGGRCQWTSDTMLIAWTSPPQWGLPTLYSTPSTSKLVLVQQLHQCAALLWLWSMVEWGYFFESVCKLFLQPNLFPLFTSIKVSTTTLKAFIEWEFSHVLQVDGIHKTYSYKSTGEAWQCIGASR